MKSGEQIARTPSHVTDGVMRPMVVNRKERTGLGKSYIDCPSHVPVPEMDIYVEEEKRVSLKGENRLWVPGINLRTYQVMGGVYPSPSSIGDNILSQPLPEEIHGDIKPWNYILSGSQQDSPVLIDGGDGKAIYPNDEYWRKEVADSMFNSPPISVKEWLNKKAPAVS